MQNLIMIRVKSFLWTISGVALTAVLAFLTSADFVSLLREYGLSASVITIISIIITELMKHLRNKNVIKNAPLGSVVRDNIVLI